MNNFDLGLVSGLATWIQKVRGLSSKMLDSSLSSFNVYRYRTCLTRRHCFWPSNWFTSPNPDSAAWAEPTHIMGPLLAHSLAQWFTWWITMSIKAAFCTRLVLVIDLFGHIKGRRDRIRKCILYQKSLNCKYTHTWFTSNAWKRIYISANRIWSRCTLTCTHTPIPTPPDTSIHTF